MTLNPNKQRSAKLHDDRDDLDKEDKFVPDKDQVNTLVYNNHCLPSVVGRA